MFNMVLERLVRGTEQIDGLDIYKDEAMRYAKFMISAKRLDMNEVKSFLQVCLNYYAHSTNGSVLIPDTIYDQCMSKYMEFGGSQLVMATPITGKKWNLVKHKVPGIVGSLNKIYTEEELIEYVDSFNMTNNFIIAPKYDGVSCSIEVVDGKIVSALTRHDGVTGQDITQLILNAGNIDKIYKELKNGFYKCELCISTKSFNKLREVQTYANRRSATSGIVNTPSNIHLAEYIDIIPLVRYNTKKGILEYIAPSSIDGVYYYTKYLMEAIFNLLERIRSKDFPYRVDGIVIFPQNGNNDIINESDILEKAIAYKSNTAEGITNIKYGYFSVGRSGKATPMLKVEPVEVNETIVEDASLSSYNKYMSMNLCEGDEVIIYSAGDVIPQVRVPHTRMNFSNRESLKIDRICPHCMEKFEKIGADYYCTNENCYRVVSGRLANFFIKLGMNGFSDKTFELLYNELKVSNPIDIIKLSIEEVMEVDGFEEISANNLIAEIKRTITTPIEVSKLIGALGISKISTKKTKRIFEIISLEELLSYTEDNIMEARWRLQTVDGIGDSTAHTFLNYFRNNLNIIKELCNLITLKPDVHYEGNIVFTGFRDDNLAEEIRELGYDVSESVTSFTIAVVAASREGSSSKLAKARQKELPIYLYSEASLLIKRLKESQLDNTDFNSMSEPVYY